ncbi:transmembrane protein 205 [Bacillus rossius redtenbacheri]|uniref:transmembrane protein 205 n=1 Tax=Bacillus rossius redtenbacheri TaxID=93214 RepID=UPI002FDCB984
MCARSLADIDSSNTETNDLINRKPKRPNVKLLKKNFAQCTEDMCVEVKNKDMKIQPDLLAITVMKYRKMVNTLTKIMGRFEEMKTYRVVFEMTQPAHLVTILAVSVIAMITYPQGGDAANPDVIKISPLISLIYLSSFMMHFGFQVWMTFVSGLSLYFNVSRHTFGEVQKVLFPRYFSVNSFLSLVTLVIFVKYHPIHVWNSCIGLQVMAMSVCFLLELVIRLYLAPPLVQLTVVKNAIEAEAGVGMEVGKYKPGSLVKCPHYVKIHCTFRRVHMAVAIGNLLTMACTTLHLHYLSQKISIV